jgi:hypothetical protein
MQGSEVTTMFRLPLFSTADDSVSTLKSIFRNWVGGNEIFNSTDRNSIWSETSVDSHPGLTQVTMIQFDHNTYPNGMDLNTTYDEEQYVALLTIGLRVETAYADEVTLHDHFRPQYLLSMIAQSNTFNLFGHELEDTPCNIKFDDVEEWLAETNLRSSILPQVLVGIKKGSDKPVVNTDTLAKLLTGVAVVHQAESAAVMTEINIQSNRGIDSPTDCIRILGIGDGSSEPVYTTRRMYLIKQKQNRSVPLDIFLRISLRTISRYKLNFSEWDTLYSYEDDEISKSGTVLDDYEVIENLNSHVDQLEYQNQTLSQQIKKLKDEKELLVQQHREAKAAAIDLEMSLGDLNVNFIELGDSLTNQKQMTNDYKQKSKLLRKEISEFKKLSEVIKRIINDHGIKKVDGLFTLLNAVGKLEDSDTDDDIVEEFDYSSVYTLIKSCKNPFYKEIVFLSEALSSAKSTNFNNTQRIMMIFEALKEIHPRCVQLTNDKKTPNFEKLLRDTKAAGTLTVANIESPLTMKNKRLALLRTFRFQNRDYVCEPHIKVGTGSRALRIHLNWCEINLKFIIGHCGNHLETSKTHS